VTGYFCLVKAADMKQKGHFWSSRVVLWQHIGTYRVDMHGNKRRKETLSLKNRARVPAREENRRKSAERHNTFHFQHFL
jgi:hypothetical protein